MLEVEFSQLALEAIATGVPDLVKVFVCWQSFKIAKSLGIEKGRSSAIRQSTAIILGIAAIAAIMMGEASCEDVDDPVRGGCSQYADDGYDATPEDRLSRFFYIVILLGVPAGFGIGESPQKRVDPRAGREDDRQTEVHED